jgi:cupin superfamily protein
VKTPALVSPLETWFDGERAVARFHAERPQAGSVAFPPRDREWRSMVPGFPDAVKLAISGVPVQVVIERRYERAPTPLRVRRALAEGATVFLPQVHQVLPRVMRLMVALRAGIFGPAREECSFLFVVQGAGRQGMGLHHDGDVEAIWLQLEGRRTVTTGPPVPRGTPEDLDEQMAGRHGAQWTTRDLEPGTLLYLPPRTPHRVVCYGRSLALSLTWKLPGRMPRSLRALAASLTAWDVAAGSAESIPPASRDRLWTQVPVAAGPLDRSGRLFPLWTAGGEIRLPAALRPLALRLAAMPSLSRAAAGPAAAALVVAGLLGPRDLPQRILPRRRLALDGWRFA